MTSPTRPTASTPAAAAERLPHDPGTGPQAGPRPLAGTGVLVRLALRRDRVMLPAWILGFSGMAALSAKATVGLYPDAATRLAAAEAINNSPALVAMYGRLYDVTSLGGLSMFKLTAWGAALLGVFAVILVVRHTRAEEESGRLELVGAGVVGRAAPLTAAILVGAGASLAIGTLTALGLTAAGLPGGGSAAFGAGWAATGMLFAAVGAAVAQVTTSARAATGLGLMLVGGAYLARAVGDMANPGPGLLSWLSPIGWTSQVRPFAGDRWQVLGLSLVTTALLVIAAFVLRERRDLGAGLLGDRPGPADGNLSTPLGLAWRLHRPAFLGWAAGTAAMSLIVGSVANTISGLVDSEALTEVLEKIGGRQGITDMFLAAEISLVSTILAAYAIAAINHLRAEESDGHAEALLATSTPRTRWATSHWAVALASVAGLVLVAGIALGIGHGLAIGDPAQIPRLTIAAATRIPAVWAMAALTLAVWGLAPRLLPAIWGLYAAFVAVGEFGELWGVPIWAANLSPFAHSPLLPGPDPDYTGLVGLLIVTAVLLTLGTAAFRRRDLATT